MERSLVLVWSNVPRLIMMLWISVTLLYPYPPIPWTVQAWSIHQLSPPPFRSGTSRRSFIKRKTPPIGTKLWSIVPEQEESSIPLVPPVTELPSSSTDSFDQQINGTLSLNADRLSVGGLTDGSNPSNNDSVDTIVPSYSKLLLFASTTVIIWLSEPLLSLVDTTIIGQFASSSSSIIQLASLGPATTYIDSLFYTTYFLSIATTNVIARNLAQENYEQLQRTVSHVSSIAAVLGSICTLFTFAAAPFLLPLMAGPSGSKQLLFYATRYVFIRASVAVASILAITSQSICLATQDTLTPALAVLATSLTNVVGDILLRHYGVQGAAMATALATLVSCSILLRAVHQQWLKWRRSMPYSSVVENRTPKSKRLGQSSFFSMFTWPDRKSAYQLITLAGPIFFVIVAKVLCYGAMTVRCTNFGVEALATHSIMMRLFFFFACFGDSLSQVAQSFMPAVLYSNKSSSHTSSEINTSEPSAKGSKQKRISDLTLMLRRLLVVGAWVGVVNSQISTTLVKYFGQHLTKDFVITSLMKKHCNYMGLSLLVHPFIMLLEGIVLANRDFRSLILTYAFTMGMHFTILSNFSNSFQAVWRTFFLFQSTRLSLYAYRVFRWWWKLRLSDDSDETVSVNVSI